MSTWKVEQIMRELAVVISFFEPPRYLDYLNQKIRLRDQIDREDG